MRKWCNHSFGVIALQRKVAGVITPFAAVDGLIRYVQSQVTHYESAPMQEVLYATLALPAVLVALNSYAVMRARLAKKRQDKLQ
jgi:hypothetical protein